MSQIVQIAIAKGNALE